MSGGSSLVPWLRSRWVIVPGAMIVFTLGWLSYVNSHDHGLG